MYGWMLGIGWVGICCKVWMWWGCLLWWYCVFFLFVIVFDVWMWMVGFGDLVIGRIWGNVIGIIVWCDGVIGGGI